MEETHKVVMIERVAVAKFDHTLEDKPTVPVDVVVQETRTEVSLGDALLMGWTPKAQQTVEPEVEATTTVKIGVGDRGGRVGD